MRTDTTASVSTHVLDTAAGRPAAGVAVTLSARRGPRAAWVEIGASATGPDGRCQDLPPLPAGTVHARLDFATGPHLAREHPGTDPFLPFFPEAAVTFAVVAGEHYHVPLLLSPFGYSVYRGS
ncbi:hydroxyisourate hydrolase [Streptomyces sp. NPDC001985]|uniref:hydroxyisourate hydrolase n=1 Tax=Streptomyces sp. NPDC001985 TaxID=3154406 RepID=UPI003329322A